MRKFIIVFILISQIYYFTFSLSSDDYDGITANIGISFLFPEYKKITGSDKFLSSFLLSSFSAGIGYNFDIVRSIFSPGIYGDIHLNIIPAVFFALYGFPGKDDNKDNNFLDNKNGENFPLLLQTGIRL